MKRLPVLWMFLAILGSWNVIRGTGTLDMTSNSTSNQTRSRRNADPLSDYSGKLSTVARISNGISLLAGLINKNIPIDTVIEELLHFGNVNLSSVLALQKDKVLGAIGNLESVQKTLEGVPDLEDMISSFRSVKRVYYSTVGDVSSFKIPADYFKQIDTFTANATVFSSSSNFIELFKKWFQHCINLVQNIDQMGNSAIDQAISDISQVYSQLAARRIEEDYQSATRVINECRLLKEDVFKWITPIHDLWTSHQSLKIPMFPGDLKSHLESLKTNLVEFDLIRQLSFSRSHHTTNLKQDIREESFKNTIGISGQDFARLSVGLKPLIELADKVDDIDKRLGILEDPKVSSSARFTDGLQQILEDSSFQKVNDELEKLEKSRLPSFTFGSDISGLTQSSQRLSNDLNSFPDLYGTFLYPPEGYHKLHEATSNRTTSSDDLDGRISILKSQPVRDSIGWLLQVKDIPEQVPDLPKIYGYAKKIRDTKDKYDAFKAQIINDVIPKLQILEQVSMDRVIQSVQAAKMITSKDIGNLKLAVETITNQTGVINGIQKTSLNQTQETRDLVKWKGLQKSSESLKSAALCIQNMEEFAKMGPLIQKIKASTVFDAEIQKVKDLQLKNEILSKYGDQKAFVALLESVLQQINAFKAKLPTAEKNLRNLGNSLESAKLVGDVVVGEKLEAIQTLMLESMRDANNLKDPQVLKDLDELKGHLETLASLDLQFSRHHSTFPGVTDALNSFFDFLGGFLTPRKPPPRPPPKPSGTSKPSGASGATGAPGTRGTPTESDSSVGMYIGIGVGILVAICALIVLGFWLYRRRNKDKKKPWEWIKRWFATTCFHTIPEALGYGKAILNEMKKESAELKTKKTDAKKMRNAALPMPLDTALILPDGRFINANYLTTWDGLKLIVAQGPMENTAVDFIFMIINQECEYVVMVCKASEVVKYVPDHPKELLKIGDYEVSMESMEDADKAVVIRKLVAYDTKEKKSHKFTHIHHCEWPDLGIPKSSDDVVGILETINKSKKPVVVHCATGVGRSVVLAGAEIIARDVERHPRKASTEPFIQLARLRLKGFQNTQQAQYTVLIAHRLLLNQYSKGSPEDEKMFAARLDMFEKVLGVLKMEEDGWEKEVNRVKTVVDGLPEVATATARPESSKELVFMLPSPERQERSNTVFDEIPTNPPQAPRAVGGVEPVVIDME